MGYIDNFTGKVWDWTKPFQRTGKFPLDRSSMFASYDDAVLYAKGDGSDSRKLGATSYIGQTITVWGPNEKGVEGVWVYSLIPTEKEGFAAELKSVGAGAGTEIATNYSAAKTLSNELVVGQLIKVSESEEVEETIDGKVVKNIYQAGFYIVNGAGSISALATSSGADDEIGALEGRIAAVESNRVLNTTFEEYQGTVTNALGTKVDGEIFSTYQSDMETALGTKADAEEFNTHKEEFNTYKSNMETALGEKALASDLNTLEGRVDTDIKNLEDLVADYSGTLTEVDNRINAVEDFVEAHISHEPIDEKDIAGLFEEKEGFEPEA